MRCACALLISAKRFASLVLIRECSLAVFWQSSTILRFFCFLQSTGKVGVFPLSVFIRFVLQFLVFPVKMSAKGESTNPCGFPLRRAGNGFYD